MNISRFAAILATLLCYISPSLADDMATAFTIKTTDGSVRHFGLTRNPRISLTDRELKVTTSDGTETFPLQSLASITYDQSVNGINSIITPFPYVIEDDLLHIPEADMRRDITITAVNGIVMDTFRIAAGKSADLSLTGYSHGVYILTINGASTKISIQ